MPKRDSTLLRECTTVKYGISVKKKEEEEERAEEERKKNSCKPKPILLFGYIMLMVALMCLFLSTILFRSIFPY